MTTSGHNRWSIHSSIHSMNILSRNLLNTHRGEPFVFLNDQNAADLGVVNGEQVKLVSNIGETILQAQSGRACRRGQVIVHPNVARKIVTPAVFRASS